MDRLCKDIFKNGFPKVPDQIFILIGEGFLIWMMLPVACDPQWGNWFWCIYCFCFDFDFEWSYFLSKNWHVYTDCQCQNRCLNHKIFIDFSTHSRNGPSFNSLVVLKGSSCYKLTLTLVDLNIFWQWIPLKQEMHELTWSKWAKMEDHVLNEHQYITQNKTPWPITVKILSKSWENHFQKYHVHRRYKNHNGTLI